MKPPYVHRFGTKLASMLVGLDAFTLRCNQATAELTAELPRASSSSTSSSTKTERPQQRQRKRPRRRIGPSSSAGYFRLYWRSGTLARGRGYGGGDEDDVEDNEEEPSPSRLAIDYLLGDSLRHGSGGGDDVAGGSGEVDGGKDKDDSSGHHEGEAMEVLFVDVTIDFVAANSGALPPSPPHRPRIDVRFGAMVRLPPPTPPPPPQSPDHREESAPAAAMYLLGPPLTECDLRSHAASIGVDFDGTESDAIADLVAKALLGCGGDEGGGGGNGGKRRSTLRADVVVERPQKRREHRPSTTTDQLNPTGVRIALRYRDLDDAEGHFLVGMGEGHEEGEGGRGSAAAATTTTTTTTKTAASRSIVSEALLAAHLAAASATATSAPPSTADRTSNDGGTRDAAAVRAFGGWWEAAATSCTATAAVPSEAERDVDRGLRAVGENGVGGSGSNGAREEEGVMLDIGNDESALLRGVEENILLGRKGAIRGGGTDRATGVMEGSSTFSANGEVSRQRLTSGRGIDCSPPAMQENDNRTSGVQGILLDNGVRPRSSPMENPYKKKMLKRGELVADENGSGSPSGLPSEEGRPQPTERSQTVDTSPQKKRKPPMHGHALVRGRYMPAMGGTKRKKKGKIRIGKM